MNRPEWPPNNKEILNSIHALFDSGQWWVYKGELVRQFEADFSAAMGCAYGASMGNGSLSLEIVLRAMGIGPEDEVILPAYNYFAFPKTVAKCGATPIFVDVYRDNVTLDIELVRAAITEHTKAIIAVHIVGSVAQLDTLREICDQAGIALIQDCAQAIGSIYGGKSVAAWGDVSLFSFGGPKLMSCGQGAMIVTDDREIYDKCHAIINKGKLLDGQFNSYDIVGENYQLSELAAAALGPQLTLLPQLVEEREAIMQMLDENLTRVSGITPFKQFSPTTIRAQMRYSFFLDIDDASERDQLLTAAHAAGIPLARGYNSVSKDPAQLKQFGYGQSFPIAEWAQDRVVSILHYDLLYGEQFWRQAVDWLAGYLEPHKTSTNES